MDKLTKDQRSKNMRAVKSSGSKIEIKLSNALWHKGFRFRKNVKSIFGKPDIAIKKYKVAIFCDSEFWHGKNWQHKKHEHKSNIEFWYKKIERNIERDREVNEYLKTKGWTVIRFCGKDIDSDIDKCVLEIEEKLSQYKY